VKPPLVVTAPLPPTRSGIADYTAELLPALAATHAVTVVVADGAAATTPDFGVAVIDVSRWRQRPDLRAAPHLHQLGNSPDHAHVYAAALEQPGVLVLHEVVMHHLVEALTRAADRPRAYEAVMAYGYGPGGRRLARLRDAGLGGDWQRFLLPLHRHLVDASRGVLVHSRYAAARVESSRAVPVRVLPHHLAPRAGDYATLTRAAARATLALPPNMPILLVLGHVTPPKQVAASLHALALLRDRGIAASLVIGGALAPASPIPALIARLGLGDRVRVTGWLEEAAFFAHLRAADLLLALRFPSGGESSGTLARALSMGLPAIVLDHGPAAEYPDAAVHKLPFTTDAAAPLADAVAALLGDPERCTAIGAAAAAHMRDAASVEGAAAAIVAAIDDWA